MTFRESLEDLKNHVGQRNAMILGVAIRGLGEGLTPEAVAEEFATTDCGTPQLTPSEVSRAITRAKEYHTGDANQNSVRFNVAMKRLKAVREGTSPEERDFVRRMIRIGEENCRKSWSDKDGPARQLLSLSPVKLLGIGSPMRTDVRRYMANHFVKALYGEDDGKIFATDNIKAPRDKSRVFTPRSICEWLGEDDEPFRNNVRHFQPLEFFCGYESPRVPTHICANMVTGENVPLKKGGNESYANKNTIKAYRNALVEFDMLDINSQAFFWYGVITTEELDVLTIVHSGGKSLHGIVRVDEMADGYDLFGGITDDARRQKWEREWSKLMRICCSDDDVAFRCDAACKDPTRMTRFPGGLRDRATEQLLVYCKE